MATINYKIYEDAVNDPTKIYIRFRGPAGLDCEVPTEILVAKKDWSKAKQKIKPTANSDDTRNHVNQTLKELKEFIFEEFNIDYKEGLTIDKDWFKAQINSFNNQSTNSEKDITIFLSDYANKFAEESKNRTNKRTGEKLKPRTIQDYQDTINKIKSFEKFIGKRLRFVNVDLKFHGDFITFLRTEQKLGDNTIGSKIDNIKSFIRNAEINKIKVNPEYKSTSFYSPAYKPKDIYFDEKEILLIKNHRFEFDNYLDNARDWLIIGLWTGLRVSDLLALTTKYLKDGHIDNTNFKTKIPVTIPIHPYVREILNKRNGEFPRRISDQNFNNYIKKVAEEIGFTDKIDGSKMCLLKDEKDNPILDADGKKMHRKKQGNYHRYELVSTHICRRSFASNLYGKIDTLTIMKITGHNTEKQFLNYIKITPKQHAEKLSKLWAEMYKINDPA
jgi:integrase